MASPDPRRPDAGRGLAAGDASADDDHGLRDVQVALPPRGTACLRSARRSRPDAAALRRLVRGGVQLGLRVRARDDAGVRRPPLRRLTRLARLAGAVPPWRSSRADREALHGHAVGLADGVRGRLGLEPRTGRPILALPDLPAGCGRGLSGGGLVVAGRSGKVRLGFHVWNDRDDVERPPRRSPRLRSEPLTTAPGHGTNAVASRLSAPDCAADGAGQVTVGGSPSRKSSGKRTSSASSTSRRARRARSRRRSRARSAGSGRSARLRYVERRRRRRGLWPRGPALHGSAPGRPSVRHRAAVQRVLRRARPTVVRPRRRRLPNLSHEPPPLCDALTARVQTRRSTATTRRARSPRRRGSARTPGCAASARRARRLRLKVLTVASPSIIAATMSPLSATAAAARPPSRRRRSRRRSSSRRPP